MNFITEENQLLFNNKIQALYFYASWMPYHKKMLVMIEKIEKKHNIEFFAIDTDFFKGLCKRFNINSIPVVLIMINSIEVKRINGITLTSAFKSAFTDICNMNNLVTMEK